MGRSSGLCVTGMPVGADAGLYSWHDVNFHLDNAWHAFAASGASHCGVCAPCSWGTFWGELGFFRLARGSNTFWIEEGDCWYAKPTFEMEEDVREGQFSGSMYGLIDNKRSLDMSAA